MSDIKKEIEEILKDFQVGVDLDRTRFFVYVKLTQLFDQKLKERDLELVNLVETWATEGTDEERKLVPGLLNYLVKNLKKGKE